MSAPSQRPRSSISSGVGKIVEYPYSTPMGSLNMILATNRDTVEKRPELAKLMVGCSARRARMPWPTRRRWWRMTTAKLGMQKAAVELAVPNVELNWQMTPQMVEQSKAYAEQMLALKQIRALPDFATFYDTRFSDDVAKTA